MRASHPDRDDLHDWLAVRGYRGSTGGQGDTTLRKRVGSDEQRAPVRDGSTAAQPAASRSYDPASSGDRAPGHEESGGYVDVDDHRY